MNSKRISWAQNALLSTALVGGGMIGSSCGEAKDIRPATTLTDAQAAEVNRVTEMVFLQARDIIRKLEEIDEHAEREGLSEADRERRVEGDPADYLFLQPLKDLFKPTKDAFLALTPEGRAATFDAVNKRLEAGAKSSQITSDDIESYAGLVVAELMLQEAVVKGKIKELDPFIRELGRTRADAEKREATAPTPEEVKAQDEFRAAAQKVFGTEAPNFVRATVVAMRLRSQDAAFDEVMRKGYAAAYELHQKEMDAHSR